MKNKNENSKGQFTLEEAEKLATKLEEEFAPICTRLKSLKAEVQKMQSMFKALCKGSVTIAGCRNFGEFCEKKLGRKRQTVYEMLGDYKNTQKKSSASGTKGVASKQSATNQLSLAHEDVERMRTGCNAAMRYFEAEAVGKEEEAEKAKQEFFAISKAESLKSVIFGDQPDFKVLLIDLLSEVEKVGEKLPVSLTRTCQAMRKRLGIDDASFGLNAFDRYQIKETKQVLAAQAA